MGTRRSKHNKGRKPRYKEHRLVGLSSDELDKEANLILFGTKDSPDDSLLGDKIFPKIVNVLCGAPIKEVKNPYKPLPVQEYKKPTNTDPIDFYSHCEDCGRKKSYGSGRRCRECYSKKSNAKYIIKKEVTDKKNEDVVQRKKMAPIWSEKFVQIELQANKESSARGFYTTISQTTPATQEDDLYKKEIHYHRYLFHRSGRYFSWEETKRRVDEHSSLNYLCLRGIGTWHDIHSAANALEKMDDKKYPDRHLFKCSSCQKYHIKLHAEIAMDKSRDFDYSSITGTWELLHSTVGI